MIPHGSAVAIDNIPKLPTGLTVGNFYLLTTVHKRFTLYAIIHYYKCSII